MTPGVFLIRKRNDVPPYGTDFFRSARGPGYTTNLREATFFACEQDARRQLDEFEEVISLESLVEFVWPDLDYTI